MALIDKEAIKKFIADGLNSGEFGHDSVTILAEVEYMPTVDAEPVRHGRWIDTEPEYCDCYAKNAHVCSKCHDFYTLDWKYMNYCPNCGAKMDEV